jgi:ABC-type oligopeptide transport system substrate-binding subunit
MPGDVGRICREADADDRRNSSIASRSAPVRSSWRVPRGQYIRLQRHPAYWRGKPLMPQVVVDLGSGGTGRLSKLLTGECDVLAWPAASQLTILRDDPRLRLTLRPGMNIAWLAFNTAAAG